MPELVVAAAVVFAVNLLPAFGPPTWAVLVGLTVWLDPPVAATVAVGAVAAACGRLLLATGARRLRGRLAPERVAGMDALRQRLLAHRAGALAGLALFALSPVPSAQLFVAAGLSGVRLLPLTAAFFAGRLVSYAGYVGAATAYEATARRALGDSLTSPAGLAVQVVALALLVALVRVDWASRLSRTQTRARGHTAPPGRRGTPAGGLHQSGR
ncbi:hypothetical protein [Conexibacter sp. SYSU D00693]|uniref:hypothetical protein n=1 Tax=Conexibacter sp. SYSU D00693 TaxID=2812560 RepID=UPI00196BA4BF|nr:hypothetical protein [Conexibacter sp. SYSU D00693]